MSKGKGFKVGDKVVAVGTAHDSELYEKGKVYEVEWVSETGRLVKMDGRWVNTDANEKQVDSRFMHERDFVEMCIDALTERYIDIEMFGTCPDLCPKMSLTSSKGTVLYRVGKEKLLDHLYPTETPQQKQLRELEQEQIAIAAKIAAVRDSM